MTEYSDEKAFELVKKIIGLDPDRTVSWLYFFGDVAFEEDETDGNPAVYFQIPSRRRHFDFGGKCGVKNIKDYVAGYYDLTKKKVVLVQICPEENEEYDEDFVSLYVEWDVSKLRTFLGWYRVDINALNYLHKDKRSLEQCIKKKPMPSWIEKHIKEREWLEYYKNAKIPKKEIEEIQKELIDYFNELRERP